MTESRTWQYRFDYDISKQDDPNAFMAGVLKKGIVSRKHQYPVTFWAWTQEFKTESGKPHLHLAVEYLEAHTDGVKKGIRTRIREALGIAKANDAEYGSGLWKNGIYWLGYMCKENLATFNGTPNTFELKTPEECLKHYREEKEKNKNVFKIKNRELLDQVALNVKNNKEYTLNKKIDTYSHLVIDEYMEECKRRKYCASYFQAKNDCQKIIFKLSQENKKIELYLKNKLFESL